MDADRRAHLLRARASLTAALPWMAPPSEPIRPQPTTTTTTTAFVDPTLYGGDAALAARDAYQDELEARALQMLEQPNPEDQPWAEVGLTLAIVYLVLHEDEEDDLPSLWLPSFHRRRRTPEEVLAKLEGLIRQFATGGYNARQQALMEQATKISPSVKKMWVSRRDSRVRDSHAIADGQTALIREPFRVGRALLPYPGWPLGPAEETMGCRCVVVLVRR